MRLTFTKAAIAAVAVAAVLALSSCSGGDDEGKQQPTTSTTATGRPVSPSPSTQPTAKATATAPVESASTGDAATQTVEGVWLATEGTTKVQLVLGKGKAALTSTHLCGGGYSDHDGIGLTLTCMDGDTERTSGHGVLASDGKTLTVEWVGGTTDVFSRTGLPSS
ncbi:hypothetical protein [Streptomyces sp. NBC_01198]|uniref:hypothetical protein n=1 Tax=Streptomyces sp. NBC_01198 TaxID=2903769 RepID=UPI002E136FB7|nr:hypothetical protein OG702_22220 [Streptomyces sp. NBC_01198]